jgi:hypothetical protein
MTPWSTTTRVARRCRAVVRPGSGDGPLSVRGAPSPSRTLRVSFGNGLRPPLSVGALAPLPASNPGPGRACPDRTRAIPAEVQQSSSEDRRRARCVPDRTVIPGTSRTLRDNPPPELTCGYDAYDSGAHVLQSNKSLGAPQRFGVLEKGRGRAGSSGARPTGGVRHETAPGYRQWMRARRRSAPPPPRSSVPCRSLPARIHRCRQRGRQPAF